MSAKSPEYLRSYTVQTVTAAVTAGSEPANGLCVDLAGAASANARGVVVNSRDGFVTICIAGTAPAKVKDGETIAVGGAVSSDANGELIATTTAVDVLGFALQAVDTASGDYIEIAIAPQPYVAAS